MSEMICPRAKECKVVGYCDAKEPHEYTEDCYNLFCPITGEPMVCIPYIPEQPKEPKSMSKKFYVRSRSNDFTLEQPKKPVEPDSLCETCKNNCVSKGIWGVSQCDYYDKQEPTCPDCNGTGINPEKFPDARCPCTYLPADLQPERQVSRDFDTIEHEAKMPLISDAVQEKLYCKWIDQDDDKYHNAIAKAQRDADMAWHKEWVAAMTRQQQDLMPAHDAEVAAKAVKEFAERVIERWNWHSFDAFAAEVRAMAEGKE